MKNLKKITTAIATMAVGGVMLVPHASAQGLGLEAAFGGAGLSNLDFQSVITIVFQILLAAAILWVVYNIVLAGIKIAGAKEDADKRKEGLKSIVNAAIGLVVALSAFAIVQIVQRQLTGSSNAQLGTPCINRTSGKAGYLDPAMDPADPAACKPAAAATAS
jgi:hypothetical protein